MPAPQIVVYRSDTQLDSELETSLASLSDTSPVTHYFSGLREAVEAARDYQPQVVVAEMTRDLSGLGEFTDEIKAASPRSAIVGVFRPDQLPTDVAESTILIQALRMGVEDFIRRPIASRDLEQLLSRRLQERHDEEDGSLGTTVAFISNKGGVGKSTMAVNVAVALAQEHPDRVLLVDGSLQMGVCATQLDLEPRATIVDAWHERDRLDGRLLRELTERHDSGLDLLAAPRTAMEAVEMDDAIISRILMLARRTYDFVVVDTFPLFDRVVMAILDLSDLAYIVFDNVVPTMRSIRGFFELLEDVEFSQDQQRLLLNRFTKLGSSPGEHEVASYLDRDVDHLVPFDRKVVQAANTGQPLMVSPSRFSATVRGVHGIVAEIESLSPSGRAESNGAHRGNGQLPQATAEPRQEEQSS